MCGIVGFFDKNRLKEDWMTEMKLMLDAIDSRGPDANGVWSSVDSKICLGHTRLSILDLSEAGAQPMKSKCGRWVISFNGEIYNFNDLKNKIEKKHHINWEGSSDTEIFLNYIIIFGLEDALEIASGMFAFALYDNTNKKLFLCRDRIGEKPLFYGWVNDIFWFGSSLNSLTKLSSFQKTIEPNALEYLLKHNYIKAPHTIYKNIKKLLPGHYLVISSENFDSSIHKYWSYQDIDGVDNKSSLTSPDDYANELENILTRAIQKYMIADVPVGAFLSGGVDSSTIVALMQKVSNAPVKTFTIGFGEKDFNEAVYAKDIANHLGTDHTELYVTSKEALDVIPMLPKMFDEPFADSSQIPTFLVSKLARESVTVSLSGDAGDELFCGYSRYDFARKNLARFEKIPKILRKSSSAFIDNFSEEQWDKIYKVIPNKVLPSNLGKKMHKLSNLLNNNEYSTDLLLYEMLAHTPSTHKLLDIDNKPNTFSEYIDHIRLDARGDIDRMMHLDIMTYLPDDILTKVDRASMAVSLESRVPFLDKEVLEFSKNIPLDIKLHNGSMKWPLQKILSNHVPKHLFERPKMGFGVPLDNWLRNDLKDWCQDYIYSNTLQHDEFLNPKGVEELYIQHLEGKQNGTMLWNIFSYLSWKRENGFG